MRTEDSYEGRSEEKYVRGKMSKRSDNERVLEEAEEANFAGRMARWKRVSVAASKQSLRYEFESQKFACAGNVALSPMLILFHQAPLTNNRWTACFLCMQVPLLQIACGNRASRLAFAAILECICILPGEILSRVGLLRGTCKLQSQLS